MAQVDTFRVRRLGHLDAQEGLLERPGLNRLADSIGTGTTHSPTLAVLSFLVKSTGWPTI